MPQVQLAPALLASHMTNFPSSSTKVPGKTGGWLKSCASATHMAYLIQAIAISWGSEPANERPLFQLLLRYIFENKDDHNFMSIFLSSHNGFKHSFYFGFELYFRLFNFFFKIERMPKMLRLLVHFLNGLNQESEITQVFHVSGRGPMHLDHLLFPPRECQQGSNAEGLRLAPVL